MDKLITCTFCKGKGLTKDYNILTDPRTLEWILKTKLCLKCHGEGNLDWIENITGKDNSSLYEFVLIHSSTRWYLEKSLS